MIKITSKESLKLPINLDHINLVAESLTLPLLAICYRYRSPFLPSHDSACRISKSNLCTDQLIQIYILRNHCTNFPSCKIKNQNPTFKMLLYWKRALLHSSTRLNLFPITYQWAVYYYYRYDWSQLMQPSGSFIKGVIHISWRTPKGIPTIHGVTWRALKF